MKGTYDRKGGNEGDGESHVLVLLARGGYPDLRELVYKAG